MGVANLFRREPLVRTIVPLHQVGVDLRLVPKASQLASAPRPLEGAHQHTGEALSRQQGGQTPGLGLSFFGEGNVGTPRVLAGETQSGFSMAHQHNIRRIEMKKCHDSLGKGWWVRLSQNACQSCSSLTRPLIGSWKRRGRRFS